MELHNDIKRFIQHTVEEISSLKMKEVDRTFTKIEIPQGNLYFIYESKITIILNNISNYEIEPIGLIFESETGEYLYYNFNENYSDKKETIKWFVENCL